jgi:hypothetical protein
MAILLFMVLSDGFSVANAKDSTLLVGGGCHEQLGKEMARESNLYIEKMRTLGWEVGSVYGGKMNPKYRGGLTLDFDAVIDNTGEISLKSSRSLTKENFIQSLSEQAEILKDGDQFLLNIVTHGSYQKQGHVICLGDGTRLDLNDPEIHRLFEKMKNRGVKIGVLDNSCYGGQTVDLFSKYGCVVSTQVADFESFESDPDDPDQRLGISTMSRKLLDHKTDTSVTLEDVFVEASFNYDVPGVFPQMTGLDRIAKKGEKSSLVIMSESGMLDHFRNAGDESVNECRADDSYPLGRSLRSIRVSVFDGIRNQVARENGYDSKLKRRKTINDQIAQLKKMDQELKASQAKLNSLEKSVTDESNHFVRDAFDSKPVEVDFGPLVSKLDRSKMKNNCKFSGSKAFCKLKMVSTVKHPERDILFSGKAPKKPFYLDFDKSIINDLVSGLFREDDQAEWEDAYNLCYQKLKEESEKRFSEFKNHPSIDRVLELAESGQYREIEKNRFQLLVKRGALLKTLSRELNVNRGLEYLSKKSEFDNQKIRSCRDFVLNPKRH